MADSQSWYISGLNSSSIIIIIYYCYYYYYIIFIIIIIIIIIILIYINHLSYDLESNVKLLEDDTLSDRYSDDIY